MKVIFGFGFILCGNEALNNQVRRPTKKLSCVVNELFPCYQLRHSWAAFVCLLCWGETSLKSHTLPCYEPEAMPESNLVAKTNTGWM